MRSFKLRSIGAEILAWSIGALGIFAVAYFAWWQLPALLWHWASQAWWHWIVAVFAYLFLLFVPVILVQSAKSPLLSVAGADARSYLLWEAASYLGTVMLFVLGLWAFAPAPEWWVPWHWSLFGAAVICSALVSIGCRMLGTVQKVDAPKPRDTYSTEWKFNHGDVSSRPVLGIAMSGGGIRSAAFNLGVLHALHDKGILYHVDVMSAVSGGSYAMSWYLLQPFYAAMAAQNEQKDFRLDEVTNEMFRPDGRFQRYLSRDPTVIKSIDAAYTAFFDATIGQPLRALAAAANTGQYNANIGSNRWDYLRQLQRLFQGVPSPNSIEIANTIKNPWADSNRFSAVTPVTYRELAEFLQQYRLPFFIFNATVLVQRAYRHMLWPTAFELTAQDVGSDVCGYRTWDGLRQLEVKTPSKGAGTFGDLGLLEERGWVVMVNIAPAISGAAIGLSYFNPKKQSRDMKLVTWTPFIGNLDLGWLFPREIWNEKGVLYVSDGGHCENLGAYALIKRQCRTIIIVDAEHEAEIPYVFAGYTKLKQRLAQEMHLAFTVSGIESYLNSAKGTNKPTGPTQEVMTGEVRPMTSNVGAAPNSVIYIKLGLDRNRLASYPRHISEYARKNPRFPQDPTSHQSFTTEQFIAYRDLGRHVARNLDQTIDAMK